MEFEVRIVGSIESCFVSLPLSLIQTLQSGYLPPILGIELRSDALQWHVTWCGAASSSFSSIEIARQYAECIGLRDRTVVKVRVVSNLPKATFVTVEPLTEDEWEILELNSELAESAILKQVGIVHEEMRFPLWLRGQTVVTFLVLSTFPKKPVVQLVPGSEVSVVPKRRKNPSLSSLEQSHLLKSVRLRVQDSDDKFIHKYMENDMKVDTIFTTGAFVHPETAKIHSFSSLQLVVIYPRLMSKEGPKEDKNDMRTKSSQIEMESDDVVLSHKRGGHLVVRILLSESVAKGHIMLPQSLRLYLEARVHSWVHVKTCQTNAKTTISRVSISPCNFQIFHNDKIHKKKASDIAENNQENHKQKRFLPGTSSKKEMGISDCSIHENIVARFAFMSFDDGKVETTVKTGLPHSKFGCGNGLYNMLYTWCVGQIETVNSNTKEDFSSLVIGSKTLLHLRANDQALQRHDVVKGGSNKMSANRNQSKETIVDIIYVLSLSEESQHDEATNVYELVLDKRNKDGCVSCLDTLLEKIQLGDLLSFHVSSETSLDILRTSMPSLDWMGTAPVDVNNRLTALLSPTSGLLFGFHNLPLPGHILIYGPPGSGKSLLAISSAKYIEGCNDTLAHVVFVSCSRLAVEKLSAIRQALSGYISEALDQAPSVIILDDLDTIIAPSSELDGSQSQSSVALINFLIDILDEYEERRRKVCGIGPLAFIVTSQALTGIPQSLSSSGRFDFHVKLPAPATGERSAILKHEIQKRCLQCTDDLLLEIASKCDGYDAYDLEILVDRTVHSAIGRLLSDCSGDNQKPTLVRSDFMQAMQNFLPVAMRDITKPAADGGRSGWEDVGGHHEIRNVIEEMIELPSKFPKIFSQAPLRMRSNVLLYGPPGCGKTHIVGAAAAACSLRFISVKGPELLNKYIGASEQAVRDIFSKAAAAAPCLLFFDEFDSIAPKRGHDNTGVTDRVVNQFLTELDGIEALTGVFVFAATSRPDLLDAALLRPGRLDRLLFCDFPSQRERLDILSVLSRKLPMANDVDLETIACMTDGCSGADIQALLSDAQLEAVHELLDSRGEAVAGKSPIITNAQLTSVAIKAKPSVSDTEKRRLYAIYNQFLDSKRSAGSQSRDTKGKRATLA